MSEVILLTPEEAARALKIGRSTLYKLLGAGEIESLSIGRARRIPRVALEAFVAGKTEEVTG